jgi:hypothetical protein
MAGFGMIIGGAMSGWSEGRLSQIKAEREARMKELEEARQDRRIAEDREFRSREAELGRQHDTSMQGRREKFEGGQRELDRSFRSEEREDTQSFQGGESEKDRRFRSTEAETDRTFRAGEGDKDRGFRREEREDDQGFRGGEAEKDRKFRSEEAERSREDAGELVTGADGASYSRRGSKVSKITDEEGKPVKLAGQRPDDAPAEVQTAEWLIRQGVAASPEEAWRLVRGARTDPEKSRAAIYKAHLALLKPEFGTADGPAIQKEAMRLTDEVMRQLDEADAPPAKKSDQQSRVRTQDTEEVGTPANVIPSDPAKRVVGKVYINKKGQQARWMGTGWEPVK